MTPQQLRDARSCHEHDIVQFRSASKAQQIPKGAYLTVSAVNDPSLTLALPMDASLNLTLAAGER